MLDNKKVLALLTARGGSKSLPKKNILTAGGKPLLAWSIEVAQRSKYIDRLVLSSDDEEIISVAKRYDCETPFIRPKELATDQASSYSVAIHALNSIEEEFDILVLLQPTSPLRNELDIDNCIELSSKTGSCVSLVESNKSPYWMYTISEDSMDPILSSKKPILRRQDSPKVYILNGAVYAVDCEWLRKNGSFIGDETVPYVMPDERSLDIDSEKDLQIFKMIKGQEL